MPAFTEIPKKIIKYKNKKISIFNLGGNLDVKTIQSFGEEWKKFKSFTNTEINNAAKQYFDIVNSVMMNLNTVVLDVGCGTGRWSKYLSDKVKFIEAIDPSEAVFSAAELLSDVKNVRISIAGVDALPFEDNSFDFVMSLGVLHHLPDTQKAIFNCVSKLKPGGYILLYLYYSLDNRGFSYKALFMISDIMRSVISRMPAFLKKAVCDVIALSIYLPLVALSRLIWRLFPNKNFEQKLPLSYYKDKSVNIIRNDALDRFGTPLEKRFSKNEITQMLERAGLTNIVFSDKEPFWHIVSKKPIYLV